MLFVRTDGRLADLCDDGYASLRAPHLLLDLAFDHTLCLGPLVFAGETACLACLASRVAHGWGDAAPPPRPRMAQQHMLAAGLVALAIERILRHEDRALVNRTVAYDFAAFTRAVEQPLPPADVPGLRDRGGRRARVARAAVGGGVVKRLVTQFDTERTRSTVATPTCCCCCCCCVGSVLSATALATIDAYDAAGRAGARRRQALAVRARRVRGAAARAARVGHGRLARRRSSARTSRSSRRSRRSTASWIAVLVAIHGRLQSPKIAKSVSLTVVFPSILFGLEFGIGAALISEGGGAGVLYLVLAAVMPFVVVPLLLLWIRSSA